VRQDLDKFLAELS